MEVCALLMTMRRFCRATSVFCFTTVRLAPWPERRASFSLLKLETCAWGGGVAVKGFYGQQGAATRCPPNAKRAPSERRGPGPTTGHPTRAPNVPLCSSLSWAVAHGTEILQHWTWPSVATARGAGRGRLSRGLRLHGVCPPARMSGGRAHQRLSGVFSGVT